jgi:hypothetical protein
MAKVTVQFWDRGPIGGWHAAVVIEGKRHPVPPKIVGDGHGAAIAVAFDSKADAERHALAHARRMLRQSAQRPGPRDCYSPG